MPKDSNSFKQRFQYYKQTGKLPYKAGSVDEELPTDAIQRMKLDINNLEQYTSDEESDGLPEVKKNKTKRTKMRKYYT